jgi:peptide/nickel transport system substrate-binding protein
LKAVGIDLEVKVVEFSAWLQDVYTNKDYDLSLVDHNESHDFYQWADPTYYYNYDNAEVQQLYAKAVAATSDEQEEQYLRQAARLVSEDAPADWLFNYRVTTAYAKGISGFPVNLNQFSLPLWNLEYIR